MSAQNWFQRAFRVDILPGKWFWLVINFWKRTNWSSCHKNSRPACAPRTKTFPSFKHTPNTQLDKRAPGVPGSSVGRVLDLWLKDCSITSYSNNYNPSTILCRYNNLLFLYRANSNKIIIPHCLLIANWTVGKDESEPDFPIWDANKHFGDCKEKRSVIVQVLICI